MDDEVEDPATESVGTGTEVSTRSGSLELREEDGWIIVLVTGGVWTELVPAIDVASIVPEASSAFRVGAPMGTIKESNRKSKVY